MSALLTYWLVGYNDLDAWTALPFMYKRNERRAPDSFGSRQCWVLYKERTAWEEHDTSLEVGHAFLSMYREGDRQEFLSVHWGIHHWEDVTYSIGRLGLRCVWDICLEKRQDTA